MRCLKIIGFFLLLLHAGATFAEANEEGNETKGPSGLPLPRFASLRSNEVNLRTGPGLRYPIEWVFVKEDLPVEITAEFDVWRRIRDSNDAKGWIHKSTLSGHRSLIVTEQTGNIYKDSNIGSSLLAHVQAGAIGDLLACDLVWCEVSFGDIKGYMKKEDFWGAYEHETFR